MIEVVNRVLVTPTVEAKDLVILGESELAGELPTEPSPDVTLESRKE